MAKIPVKVSAAEICFQMFGIEQRHVIYYFFFFNPPHDILITCNRNANKLVIVEREWEHPHV